MPEDESTSSSAASSTAASATATAILPASGNGENHKEREAFPRLTADDLEELAPYAQCGLYEDGEALFEAGKRGMKFFVVLEGEIEIVESSSGDDRIIAVHGPGQFTGDVDMVTDRTAIVTARARGRTRVYVISPENLRRIISEKPELSETILKAFLTRRELLEEFGLVGIRVIGSRYSRHTLRIREFLAKNRVPYTWIDPEDAAQVEAMLGQFDISLEQMPIVMCSSNNTMLRNPTVENLAQCIGIKKPIDRTLYDFVIVGAGPAGLAAAVYGASEGLRTLVLDKTGPGGQAGTSSKIENYLGFPTGISGAELARLAVVQANKFGAEIISPIEAVTMECHQTLHLLSFDNGEEASARTVLIATGAEYRRLELAGCERFEGCGIYYAATNVEAAMCTDCPVIVVGGGNSAGQAAVYLAESADRVVLVLRGDNLGDSMSHYLARRIEQTDNIDVRTHCAISAMEAKESGESGTNGENNQTLGSVTIRDRHGEETIDAGHVFVFIGATPRTAWLPDSIHTDSEGFIRTGQQLRRRDLDASHFPGRTPLYLETSCPGVFAAGDVRRNSIKRVASAAGEGAMAVHFVHRALAVV